MSDSTRADRVFGHFPELLTPRLLLRDLTPGDASDLYAVFGDSEVTRYYDLDPFTDVIQARDLVDRFILRYQRRIGIRWAICRREAPSRVLGTCGYNLWVQTSRRGLLGYDLARAHWRRGIMTEALSAVLRYGFGTMDLNRVEALVCVGHQASERLLARLGLRPEGILRQYERIGGALADMTMHALLRREAGALAPPQPEPVPVP
ncbi:MAG: GNAT family protein [Gemmatimonadota bacterium]